MEVALNSLEIDSSKTIPETLFNTIRNTVSLKVWALLLASWVMLEWCWGVGVYQQSPYYWSSPSCSYYYPCVTRSTVIVRKNYSTSSTQTSSSIWFWWWGSYSREHHWDHPRWGGNHWGGRGR